MDFVLNRLPSPVYPDGRLLENFGQQSRRYAWTSTIAEFAPSKIKLTIHCFPNIPRQILAGNAELPDWFISKRAVFRRTFNPMIQNLSFDISTMIFLALAVFRLRLQDPIACKNRYHAVFDQFIISRQTKVFR